MSNLLFTLAVGSLIVGIVAYYRPALARTSSPDQALGVYIIAFVIFLAGGAAFESSLNAGASEMEPWPVDDVATLDAAAREIEMGEFADASLRLTDIPKGHADYDSAQVLDARAREGQMANALKAREETMNQTAAPIPASDNFEGIAVKQASVTRGTKSAPRGRKIEWQVAMDAIRQYEMVQRHGSEVDRCVHAGIVAAAFLQAQVEDRYEEWKAIEREDCAGAGVPR